MVWVGLGAGFGHTTPLENIAFVQLIVFVSVGEAVVGQHSSLVQGPTPLLCLALCRTHFVFLLLFVSLFDLTLPFLSLMSCYIQELLVAFVVSSVAFFLRGIVAYGVVCLCCHCCCCCCRRRRCRRRSCSAHNEALKTHPSQQQKKVHLQISVEHLGLFLADVWACPRDGSRVFHVATSQSSRIEGTVFLW